MSAVTADLFVRPVAMRVRALPRPLVSKREAEVYPLEGGRVLKAFRLHVPSARIEHEHRLAALVHRHGLPVPAVEARPVALDDGRRGLVYEHIEGTTLAARLAQRPLRVADAFVHLRRALDGVHAVAAIEEVPAQRTRLRQRIARASRVPLRERQQLLALLDAMPVTASRLCHGNPVPSNVIVRDDGSVVLLSWNSACVGEPECDLARAAILLGHPTEPRTGVGGLLEAWFLARRRRAWIDDLAARAGHDPQRLTRWLAINATVRLDECIGHRHEAALLALVRHALAQP